MPTISDEVRETSDLIFSEEETEAMKSPKRRTCLAIFVVILKTTLKDILECDRKLVGTAFQIKLGMYFSTLFLFSTFRGKC